MKFKHPVNLNIFLLLFTALSLSSCTMESHKPPISEIYAQLCYRPYHLGHYFFTFQNGFLNIVLFIILFTLSQYWQNRRADYLYYAFYLLITWLYFARVLPPYFYFLFSNYEHYNKFDKFLTLTIRNELSYQVELIFFHFLTAFYILFLRTFFNFKDQQPQVDRIIRIGLILLFASGLLFTLQLLVSKYYLKNFQMLLLKLIYLLPSVWLMIKIIKSKLPGAVYIVLGSSALLAGSIWVGILHLLGDSIPGKRVFLQMGILLEILFFSAALGRKDRALQLRFSLTQQEYDNTIREKQRIDEEKYKAEQRLTQVKFRLRKQMNQIQNLQRELEKRYNGNNSLKPKPTPEETFTEKLERIMEEHFSDSSFKVPNLIHAMGLEHGTLYRHIKERYQVSIEIFLLNYRVDKSKALMLNPDLNLQQIAAKVGYPDYQQFSALFKKKEGIAPSKYRKNLLGKS